MLSLAVVRRPNPASTSEARRERKRQHDTRPNCRAEGKREGRPRPQVNTKYNEGKYTYIQGSGNLWLGRIPDEFPTERQ